jgi:site-specific DNA recombinase
MIAAIYIRVSTEMQVEDGFSISAQTRLLTDYCQKEGITVFKIYADEGLSGQKENRPQFQEMLNDAENKNFNIILVHKFDRFARKVELSQRIKKQLKSAGVNVISMTEPIEDSPIGFFQEGIMELLSEYYVRNLAIEVKKGLVEASKQGQVTGRVPFGYNKDMTINNEQATIIKQIFDWYTNTGYGVNKIANMLNENRVPAACGNHWTQVRIKQIIQNVKYVGDIYFSGEVYLGKHEPIIDRISFEKTQDIFNKKKTERTRCGSNYEKFLLAGMLRCGICGYPMRTKHTKYYLCSEYDSHSIPKICDHKKCHNIIDLETSIIEAFRNPLTQTKIINSIRNVNSNELLFKNRKTKIKTELEKSRQAFLKGVFTEEEYLADKEKCNKELIEIGKFESVKIQHIKPSIVINNAMDDFENTRSILEQKAKLKKFIDNIVVFPSGEIKVNIYL